MCLLTLNRTLKPTLNWLHLNDTLSSQRTAIDLDLDRNQQFTCGFCFQRTVAKNRMQRCNALVRKDLRTVESATWTVRGRLCGSRCGPNDCGSAPRSTAESRFRMGVIRLQKPPFPVRHKLPDRQKLDLEKSY